MHDRRRWRAGELAKFPAPGPLNEAAKSMNSGPVIRCELGAHRNARGPSQVVAAVAAVADSTVRSVIGRLPLRASLDSHSEANLLAELAGLHGGQ